jgi:serine protease
MEGFSMRRHIGLGVLALLASIITGISAAGPLTAALDRVAGTGLVPNQYIVVLGKPQDGQALAGLPVAEQVQTLLAGVGGGQLLHVYEHALRGFAVRLTPLQAELLARHPLVDYVEQDREVRAVATQSNATWGLDRVDQRNLPLDGRYSYPDLAGQGAHVYVIDTGINPNHVEFSGRVGASRNFVGGLLGLGSPDPNAWQDCNGHGTHVAGTSAGSSYGIAKKATVHAVRVLDCQGSGTGSAIIAGIDWVAANHQAPAVANLSLGTVGGRSQAQEDAVRNLVNANVAVAVAAGNDNANACNTSPAAEPSVLTVGASTRTDSRDTSYSNFGSCLDLFAPGTGITSAWHSSNTATSTISGTSMASPHVAGALALLRAASPGLGAAQTQSQLVADSTSGVLSNVGSGSPNKLLYVVNGGATPVDNPPLAAFSHSCNGLVCSFDGSSSSDDHGIAAYSWNFGDGGSGNGAVLNHSYAAGGSYSVTLTVTDSVGQTDTETRTVTVSSTSGPCSDCTQVSGSLSSGGTAYVTSSSGFSSGGGQFKGYLRGPANADFDLYLEKRTTGLLGSSWSIVARAEGNTSSEDIVYTGTAGTYRWRLKSYSGSGAYDFYYKNP